MRNRNRNQSRPERYQNGHLAPSDWLEGSRRDRKEKLDAICEENDFAKQFEDHDISAVRTATSEFQLTLNREQAEAYLAFLRA